MISINHVRKDLKRKAKQALNPHFKFFAILILPWIIMAILSRINTNITLRKNSLSTLFQGDALDLFIGILAYLFITSVTFACLNLIRHQAPYHGPLNQSTTIFHNGNYFIGSLMILILRTIWTFLWSILLIFPGIIKSLAYSQAQLIYKDAIDNGQHIKYRDAITKSRHLMSGHKWELFVINLSFIGWWILSLLTLHLADFWIMPYYQLTLVNFYQKLLQNQNN